VILSVCQAFKLYQNNFHARSYLNVNKRKILFIT